jgi:carbamoyl-phosphate synthase large subunit
MNPSAPIRPRFSRQVGCFLSDRTIRNRHVTQRAETIHGAIHSMPEATLRTADQLEEIVSRDILVQAKEMGYSDHQLASLWDSDELTVRELRIRLGVIPTYKTVDTCAAEFEAFTPYHYSTYERECEVVRSDRKKIMILGGGPNRIGQGIEFDYCCCHASFALREQGYETIMVNSNPETVSTDYDTSDKLYFEPLTIEDVLNICDKERPDGVIVQFGGQTPLKLAVGLKERGVNIIGTSPESIDMAEDRKLFGALVNKLGIMQPNNGTATSADEALVIAEKIGYPVLVRPSYVLGGRAMAIVHDSEQLGHYMREAVTASPERPVLVDSFLDDAIEIDVDAVSDGKTSVIGGIMQHIEYAGVHSGDSACVLPPYSLSDAVIEQVTRHTKDLARELNVVGLMNIQYAVKNDDVYVLEVNPRASRTVPFVSKAIGYPLAKIAARVMVGQTLEEIGFTQEVIPDYYSVKEAVLPFLKFLGADILLGPEMKSTGEVMGISDTVGESYAKSQMAASMQLPTGGTVFISAGTAEQKLGLVEPARQLAEIGFDIIATKGTQRTLAEHGVQAELVPKLSEGRPHVVDMMKSNNIALIINVPVGKVSTEDEKLIRRETIRRGLPYITTVAAASVAIEAITIVRNQDINVCSLQERHEQMVARTGTA